MNHQKLITSLAQRTGLTQIVTKDVLDALSEQATENFRQGDNLSILGVGKLTVVSRRARTARNVLTGAPVQVPERRSIKFSMSQRLKESLA